MISENDGLTEWCHLIPPEHLFNQRVNVGKVVLVGQRWEPVIPNNPIDLRLSFALDFWMCHHCQAEPMCHRYRLGGGVRVQWVEVAKICVSGYGRKKQDERTPQCPLLLEAREQTCPVSMWGTFPGEACGAYLHISKRPST